MNGSQGRSENKLNFQFNAALTAINIANALIPAPDQEILPGITRIKVIELAILNGIPIKYESINSADFSDIESVFLTGTSPKVLPVRRVGDLLFRIARVLDTK